MQAKGKKKQHAAMLGASKQMCAFIPYIPVPDRTLCMLFYILLASQLNHFAITHLVGSCKPRDHSSLPDDLLSHSRVLARDEPAAQSMLPRLTTKASYISCYPSRALSVNPPVARRGLRPKPCPQGLLRGSPPWQLCH
jgi:hypothetical protein